MPKTIITKNLDVIKQFRKANNEIVIKPLYGNGGEGVFHIKQNDDNLNSIMEMCSKIYKEPMIAQEYISKVREGDKRIILIDGEIAGAINRVPAAGESRSNMHVGGTAEETKITERDLEICKKISPLLKAKNLFLVGIDVIGNFITEINVTSPTGIREINSIYNTNVQKVFFEKLEQKLEYHFS